MSDILTFVGVGFRHIADLRAADHILFLLVLAAVYRRRDWRALLWVVSAFTIGHSVALALVVTEVLVLPPAVVEFLIPITIVLTGIENLRPRDRAIAAAGALYRPMLAGVFGLIHGAGFAGYLRALFVEDIALPLLGFNLGIEAGQLVVLLLAAAFFAILDRAFGLLRNEHLAWEPFQLRGAGVSAVVIAIATAWAWERFPL